MKSHRFDPISAALGVVAVGTGALVAFDAVESTGVGWWLALAALVLGLGLVPWSGDRSGSRSGAQGRTPDMPPDDTLDAVGADGAVDGAVAADPGPAPRFKL